MPKIPSNKLFRLIKSLSGSEKRYFKIYIHTKGGKENKYINLFEAIEAQEEFDDASLQNAIYKDEVSGGRKYSELKAYLYENILKSLQSYDEKSSVDYRIKGMLLSVRTLYKRSLYSNCKELLNKTKKLASKYENFNAELEILRWEKQIAYAETDITYLDKHLERIRTEETKLLKRIQNISEYRNIFFELLISLRKDAASGKKTIEKLSFIKEHELMNNIENAETYTARTLYYRVLSLYYIASLDYENAYQISRKLLVHLEHKKYMLEEDASEYIAVLSNHVVVSGNLGKFLEIEETLNKFKKVKANTLDDELKIYRQYYLGKFRLYIESGEFEKGYEELQQHKQSRKKFEEATFKKDTFYIKYFTICFGVEEYEEALQYLNEWLGMSKNVERKDLQSLARLLNIIIHHEMQNATILDSLIRSAYRYLSEKDFYSAFEKKLLNSLREVTEYPSRKELKKIWQDLLEEYNKMHNEKTLVPSMRWFPIYEWILSKAHGRSFAETVREKFQGSLAQ